MSNEFMMIQKSLIIVKIYNSSSSSGGGQWQMSAKTGHELRLFNSRILNAVASIEVHNRL